MSLDQLIAITVPVIVVFFGWFLKRIDRRNSQQHSEAQATRLAQSEHVNKSLARIEEKVDEHILWHAHNPKQEVLIK